jgi:2-methylcitrate dehydratase PrpD
MTARPVHPNAAQIPAVLPLAEATRGIDGRTLIAALAVGCDLTCRLGMCLDEDPSRFGWYPPPILGAYGAVAACARLAGLDADWVIDAFSLLLCSSTCSAEIKYAPRSDLRAVRDAFPAQAALQAVLLARAGVTGFDAPFEGKAGFFALYPRGGYDPAILLEIEAIDLVGHPVMAMLDAPHAAKRAPATAIDAKFSLPYTVASALIDGAVTLDSFTPAAMARADVRALAERVRFTPLADAPANAIASGGIALRLSDGRTLERFVAEPRGAPSNPLSDAELAAKFRSCAAHARVPLSDDTIERLIARIGVLEQSDDVADLLTFA